MGKKINENLNEMLAHNASITGTNIKGLNQKWGKQLRAINEAFDGKIEPHKLTTTAVLLENTERFLNNRARFLNEATQPSDTSFFKRFAINLLSAVTPNLIAEDICSVQPINCVA